MKRIRYQDMPPERRAQFDKARFKFWVDSGGKFDVDSTGDVARITFDDKVIEIPWNELHLRMVVD